MGVKKLLTFFYLFYYHKRMLDVTKQNNHAWIKRLEESEKAEALLKIINEYRVYTQRFAELPTWDVLEFLQKLDNEVNERYNKEVEDKERNKIREEYFLLTHKKPFWGWSNERILDEMEKYKEKWEVTDLLSKKKRWNKN